MNTEEEKPVVIKDENEDKLAEPSTSNESIPSEATTVVSDGSEPQTVSTDMGMSSENSEPVDSQPNSEQMSDSNVSELQPSTGSETQPPAGPEAEPTAETEPQPIAIPVNENKPESKTKKHYDQIINKANNVKSQFTKKRRTMSTWDDKEKQEWRVKLSDTLINIIRQSKNKNTLKHHHGKLKSMRNLFNYYLNNLSNSGQPKKTKSKNSKISKK
jgi:hypothetical protein